MTNPKHTDTSRIADLRFQVSEKMPINHSDLSCLFDHIEALEAENERLIKAGDGDAGLIHWQGERIEQLEAALTKSEALQDAVLTRFELDGVGPRSDEEEQRDVDAARAEADVRVELIRTRILHKALSHAPKGD